MKSERLFWELLELSDAKLIVDNDVCMIAYDYDEDEEEYKEHQSFDFGPEELVFMLADKLDIKAETV